MRSASHEGYLVLGKEDNEIIGFYEGISEAVEQAEWWALPRPANGNIAHPSYIVKAHQVTTE